MTTMTMGTMTAVVTMTMTTIDASVRSPANVATLAGISQPRD